MGGRGVLLPATIFSKIGFFDEVNLPHYGADNDFGLKAKEIGYEIVILPDARIGTRVEDTSLMNKPKDVSFAPRLKGLLFDRRNGSMALVWWTLCKRHTPFWATLPTYLQTLGVTIKRAWQESRAY